MTKERIKTIAQLALDACRQAEEHEQQTGERQSRAEVLENIAVCVAMWADAQPDEIGKLVQTVETVYDCYRQGWLDKIKLMYDL